jgi:hypothetical protein
VREEEEDVGVEMKRTESVPARGLRLAADQHSPPIQPSSRNNVVGATPRSQSELRELWTTRRHCTGGEGGDIGCGGEG